MISFLLHFLQFWIHLLCTDDPFSKPLYVLLRKESFYRTYRK